jgi:hypothetical protein
MTTYTNLIQQKFSNTKRETLARSFEQDEVLSTAKPMAINKSPDPYGFANQLFIQYWDFVGAKFIQMLSHSQWCGSLPDAMKGGRKII